MVGVKDSGFGFVIDSAVSMTTSISGATATFTGPLEAVVRLFGGRLDSQHTPEGVTVTGNVILDDLRAVFPGF